MPCFRPRDAFYSRIRNPSGKRSLVFNGSALGNPSMPVKVPCGYCVGCRLDRSRDWAVRCVHEASLHSDNCFITLTYDDAHLNERLASGGVMTLVKRDFVLFMKRLRKRFGAGIRFFHCGEYGSINRRPHDHACIFGFNFPDRYLFNVCNDVPIYRSMALEELWPYGFCTVGDVTFESAAYVARYVMKKIYGEASVVHYKDRVPEYTTMSRRPGIAADWYAKYSSEVFANDFVMVNGRTSKVPKYYNLKYDLSNPIEYAILSHDREVKAKLSPDNSYDRLRVREVVQEAALAKLVRNAV